jgi:hypothetical protein
VTRCPSDLELESYLLEPAGSRLEPHLDACTRCREQLAEMRRVGDEFRREVFPATVDAVVERSGARRRPRWLLVAAPLSAAAAAAILLAVRAPSSYVGVKGGGLALTVFVDGADGARAAADGQAVPAGAALRFEVRPARTCQLWIVSIDGRGQVSRLFPASGETAASVATAGTLPGGALLDGRAGPERIYAVCTPSALAFNEVERAAHAAAAGGDGGVRSARDLAGLPGNAAQATVLLEKRP